MSVTIPDLFHKEYSILHLFRVVMQVVIEENKKYI